MKKLTILSLIFLSITVLFSCVDKKHQKGKLTEEIQMACDVISYSNEILGKLEELLDEARELVSKYDNEDKFLEDNKQKVEEYEERIEEYFDELESASRYAYKKFRKELISTINNKPVIYGTNACYSEKKTFRLLYQKTSSFTEQWGSFEKEFFPSEDYGGSIVWRTLSRGPLSYQEWVNEFCPPEFYSDFEYRNSKFSFKEFRKLPLD